MHSSTRMSHKKSLLTNKKLSSPPNLQQTLRIKAAMTFLSQVSSTVPISNSVTYSCTFKNNWSAENHPVGYPGDMAHWSPPVVVSHNDRYSMWAPGDLASLGVETVAEVRP